MKKLIPIGIVAALALSVAGTPATAQQRESKNIVQTAQAAGTFKTLTKLAVKAGLALNPAFSISRVRNLWTTRSSAMSRSTL